MPARCRALEDPGQPLLSAGGAPVGRYWREEVESRRLLTVTETSPYWSSSDVKLAGAAAQALKGAIVRIRPPHDATDARVAELVADFTDRAGAAAVTLLPRAAAPRTVTKERAEALAGKRESRQSPRAVVLARAAATKSRDPAALENLLDVALTRAGL